MKNSNYKNCRFNLASPIEVKIMEITICYKKINGLIKILKILYKIINRKHPDLQFQI